jgi:hypothetical protein
LCIGTCNGYITRVRFYYPADTRAEAESTTSTVTLRVVGGDEKGSLKYETVKDGHESQDYAGEHQQHTQKTDPSSRQIGRPTRTRPYLSKSNKYLVMSRRWGSILRLTDRLTVSHNVTVTLTSTD